jgi:polyhydroxyalkanoate synthase subunit PhaC
MTRDSTPELPRAKLDPDSLSEEAARNTLALNPLIGLRGKDLMDGAATLLKAMVNEPAVAGGQWLSFLTEIGRIGAGQSDRVQQAGDKRFADATWKNSGPHRQLL